MRKEASKSKLLPKKPDLIGSGPTVRSSEIWNKKTSGKSKKPLIFVIATSIITIMISTKMIFFTQEENPSLQAQYSKKSAVEVLTSMYNDPLKINTQNVKKRITKIKRELASSYKNPSHGQEKQMETNLDSPTNDKEKRPTSWEFIDEVSPEHMDEYERESRTLDINMIDSF